MTTIDKYFFFTWCLIATNYCFCQRTIYHKCEMGDPGDFHIIQWEISSNPLPQQYVLEKIDSNGRVKELKFISNNSLTYSVECGIYPWIIFKYPNDTIIIETFLNGYGQNKSDLECGEPCRVTYFLSKDQRTIIKCKSEYFIDTALYLKNGMTFQAIKDALKSLKSEKTENDFVLYFSQSKTKLNGKYPISIKFKSQNYIFDSIEQLEINKSLLMK